MFIMFLMCGRKWGKRLSIWGLLFFDRLFLGRNFLITKGDRDAHVLELLTSQNGAPRL